MFSNKSYFVGITISHDYQCLLDLNLLFEIMKYIDFLTSVESSEDQHVSFINKCLIDSTKCKN